jgi:hypothetical protein
VSLFTATPAGPLMRSRVADAQSHDEIARALRDQWPRPRRAVSAGAIGTGFAADLVRPVVDGLR